MESISWLFCVCTSTTRSHVFKEKERSPNQASTVWPKNQQRRRHKEEANTINTKGGLKKQIQGCVTLSAAWRVGYHRAWPVMGYGRYMRSDTKLWMDTIPYLIDRCLIVS
ncbi:uncharacterized protein BDCG_16890 [Blastomyces dermatitidis ER-3]|uniref:Uncharacterized protein n=1 Tax=Ajellomyces dermatitidis (strain ER-3 / ATCC MYA-2586) TaxID=559297 RepID=A0ABP2EY41_AJEDR|nr:uncharacterized protein BDCG_16890 [Blastomyces dermatitidis ER-3]EEQ89099.2 hypothetical protein BDCG_16890 [Blastomyces dermatitidis ER-3]